MSQWEMKLLGEVAEVAAGNPAPQADHDFAAGGAPFFRTSDIGKVKVGTIADCADRLAPSATKRMRLFRKGTILFPKSGASTFLNHRVVMAVDGYVSSHLATITARPGIDERYLFYFLTTIRAQDLLQDQSYPSLRLSDLERVAVAVPQLAEQRRIVALLDEAFAGLAKMR